MALGLKKTLKTTKSKFSIHIIEEDIRLCFQLRVYA